MVSFNEMQRYFEFQPKMLWHVLTPQLEGQVVALLVQNMERLDEQVKEEADGIHNTLGKHHSVSAHSPD